MMPIVCRYNGEWRTVKNMYNKIDDTFKNVKKVLRKGSNGVFRQVFGITDTFILDNCYIYTSGTLTLSESFRACIDVEPQVDFVVDGATLWRAYSPLPNPHRPDLGYNVTKLTKTFYDYTQMTSLDLSGWDVSAVTTLANAWWKCNALATLDLSGWNVSNVTSLGSAWKECKALTSLDISGWDTSKVKTLSSPWFGCTSLTTLDLSGWDVSNVTALASAWINCTSLTSLDLSNWSLGKVTSFLNTWKGCALLSTEVTISNLNVIKYTGAFLNAATAEGALITVHYTPECYDLAAAIVATKSETSNVVIGSEVNESLSEEME